MDTRAVRVLLCCLVVLWGVGVAAGPALATSDAVGGSDDVGADFDSIGAVSATQEIGDDEDGEDEYRPSLGGFDEVNVAIELRDNGSAAWTVEYRYRLDDENATEDWEALRGNVSNRPGEYILMFRDRNAGLVADAENATDRNMSTWNFSVETDESFSPQAYGYVRFTFEWSAFALVEVNRIKAGPALSGFTMDERTQLTFSWPEDYENVTVEPEPDDQSENGVIWYGDETREFVGEPHIELIRTGGEPLGAPKEEEEPPLGVPLSWALGASILVLVVLGATGIAAWSRTRADGGEETPEMGRAPPPEPEDGEEEPVKPAPPPELLSNEERVLGLLEDRGGRIKQQEVAAELGWAEGKTSQVVSGLREDGEVEVFRIGRENTLVLENGDEADGREGEPSEQEEPDGA